MVKYKEQSKKNLFIAFLLDNNITIICIVGGIIYSIIWYYFNIYLAFLIWIIFMAFSVFFIESKFFKLNRCIFKQVQFCHYKAKQEKLEKILEKKGFLTDENVLKHTIEKKDTCLKIAKIVFEYKLLQKVIIFLAVLFTN